MDFMSRTDGRQNSLMVVRNKSIMSSSKKVRSGLFSPKATSLISEKVSMMASDYDCVSVIDNSQLDKISVNLAKLCQSVCDNDSSDQEEDIGLKNLNKEAAEESKQ